jgi:hypothetical protein
MVSDPPKHLVATQVDVLEREVAQSGAQPYCPWVGQLGERPLDANVELPTRVAGARLRQRHLFWNLQSRFLLEQFADPRGVQHIATRALSTRTGATSSGETSNVRPSTSTRPSSARPARL